MWATLGEYPVDMSLSMAIEADAYGVPREKMTTPPDLVNGDAGHPVPQTALVIPFLDPIYGLQKDHTVYIPETTASLSRQHQLPCPEMTLE